jgi:hypothetical protein
MWAKRRLAVKRTATADHVGGLDLPWLEQPPWPWRIPQRYKHLEQHRAVKAR